MDGLLVYGGGLRALGLLGVKGVVMVVVNLYLLFGHYIVLLHFFLVITVKVAAVGDDQKGRFLFGLVEGLFERGFVMSLVMVGIIIMVVLGFGLVLIEQELVVVVVMVPVAHLCLGESVN